MENIVATTFDLNYPETFFVGNMKFQRGMAMRQEAKYIYEDFPNNRIVMIVLRHHDWKIDYAIQHGLGWSIIKTEEFEYAFPHDFQFELKRIIRLTKNWITSTESRLNVDEEHRKIDDLTLEEIRRSI